MNRLRQLRARLNGNIGVGYDSSGLAASSAEVIMDNSTYDALITQKQREIVSLVAEANNSNNNYDNFAPLIRERQIELNGLMKSKSIKEFRRALMLNF
ncbi:MAG TPA: hypothetical protein VH415_16330 [Nitrososphaeraceae archaeon]|jgi:hypothetical protein